MPSKFRKYVAVARAKTRRGKFRTSNSLENAPEMTETTASGAGQGENGGGLLCRLPPEVLIIIFMEFVPPISTHFYPTPPHLYGYSTLASLALVHSMLLQIARFVLYTHPRLRTFRSLEAFYRTINSARELREMVSEVELQFSALQAGRRQQPTFPFVKVILLDPQKVDTSIEQRLLGSCRLREVVFFDWPMFYLSTAFSALRLSSYSSLRSLTISSRSQHTQFHAFPAFLPYLTSLTHLSLHTVIARSSDEVKWTHGMPKYNLKELKMRQCDVHIDGVVGLLGAGRLNTLTIVNSMNGAFWEAVIRRVPILQETVRKLDWQTISPFWAYPELFIRMPNALRKLKELKYLGIMFWQKEPHAFEQFEEDDTSPENMLLQYVDGQSLISRLDKLKLDMVLEPHEVGMWRDFWAEQLDLRQWGVIKRLEHEMKSGSTIEVWEGGYRRIFVKKGT